MPERERLTVLASGEGWSPTPGGSPSEINGLKAYPSATRSGASGPSRPACVIANPVIPRIEVSQLSHLKYDRETDRVSRLKFPGKYLDANG